MTTCRQTNKENYQANNKQPQTKGKGRLAKGKSPLKQVAETTVQQFQPQQHQEKTEAVKTQPAQR